MPDVQQSLAEPMRRWRSDACRTQHRAPNRSLAIRTKLMPVSPRNRRARGAWATELDAGQTFGPQPSRSSIR